MVEDGAFSHKIEYILKKKKRKIIIISKGILSQAPEKFLAAQAVLKSQKGTSKFSYMLLNTKLVRKTRKNYLL